MNNLLRCGNIDFNQIAEEITECLECNIDWEIANLKHTIKNKMIETESQNDIYFSRRFESYVMKLKKKQESDWQLDKANRRTKAPDYFLLKAYDEICRASDTVRFKTFRKDELKCGQYTGISLVDDFEKCYKYYIGNASGIISKNQITRILKAPENWDKAMHEKTVMYMLEKVLPHIWSIDDTSRKNIIRCGWKDIIYKDLETYKQKICGKDKDIESEINKELERLFDEFSSMNSDPQIEGTKLVEMYMVLKDLYNKQMLVSVEDVSVQQNIFNNPGFISKREPFIPDYDAKISTHILGFMKWLPMLEDETKDYELMKSVDNIVAEIRDEVKEDIKKYEYFNKDDENYFFRGSKEQRIILIRAMYKETGIVKRFKNYYYVNT